MEDFNGLASSLAAGVSDVRGCLILSNDGLVLGSHPLEAEGSARAAWVHFGALGDPERGFVQFGTATWCYVRRGPYAAFSVVGPAARPGLVLDHMEQVLLAAEEARVRRESLRSEPAAPAGAPSAGPRTQLHPEPPVIEEPLMIAVDVGDRSGPGDAFQPPDLEAPGEPSVEVLEPSTPEPLAPAEPLGPRPPEGPEGDGREPSIEEFWEAGDGSGEADEVDRFSLAREFRQLLQDGETGADG